MDLKNEGKNSKKKRRIPLFDIALLLLIAIAVAAGSYWAANRGQTPTAELVYTVRFSGVDNAYSGTLAQGKTLYSPNGTPMGEIEAVSVTRALETRFDSNVSADTSEDTYRYTEIHSTEKSDIVITVRVTAQQRNGGYFVNGNRVAAGLNVDAMVTGYLGNGLILTVDTVSEIAVSDS